MTHHFNVSGSERKNLVKKISEHLGVEAKYLGVPSCAYQIGSYTVAKDGSLSWNDLDDADPAHMDESCSLIQALEAAGFKSDEMTFLAEQQEAIEGQVEETTEEPETTETTEKADADSNAEADVESDAEAGVESDAEAGDKEDAPLESAQTDAGSDGTALTISLPKSSLPDDAREKMDKLLESKGQLILKALGAGSLKIEADEEKVNFPWFDRIPEADQLEAYTKFITALCKMAREAKRITAKEKENENEKYAFRCFLLRLGFIGDEFKKDRKILLKNFDGSSAFRSQEAAERFKEQQAAKKAAAEATVDTVQTEATAESGGEPTEATAE